MGLFMYIQFGSVFIMSGVIHGYQVSMIRNQKWEKDVSHHASATLLPHDHEVSMTSKVGAFETMGRIHWKSNLGKETPGRKRIKRQVVSNPRAVIERIVPEYGQKGGHNVYIHGNYFHLLSSDVSIKLGQTPCICTSYGKTLFGNSSSCHNDTVIVCTYTHATDTTDVSVPVTVMHEGGTLVGKINQVHFIFKENAVVLDMHPRRTIQRGGTAMTVQGQNFNSAHEVKLLLWLINSDKVFNEAIGLCEVITDTQAICVTPRLTYPGSYRYDRRRKRQAKITTCINDGVLDINISLIFDSLITEVTKVDKTQNMCVTRNPNFKMFQDDIYMFELYKGKTELRLEGTRLDYGIQQEDYKVFVGKAICNITRLVTNILTCKPPLTVPDDLAGLGKEGRPSVRIMAGENMNFLPGYVDYQHKKPGDVNLPAVLGGLVGGIIFLIILIACLCWYKRRGKKHLKEEPQSTAYDHRHDDYKTLKASFVDLLDEDMKKLVDDCCLKSHNLEMVKEIGSGHYGKVFIGKLSIKGKENLRKKTVAVKTIKDQGVSLLQLKEFLSEATLMKDLKHKNVLSLIGVFIEGNKPFVVLPFMKNGDLKSYCSNPANRLRIYDLINYSKQVADGMTFLSEQKIIHRDLRAVNCLVDKDMVVKVADFGLSRDIYRDDYYTPQDTQRPLPIKWMAPEALEGHPVSSKADVWSFGVLMWEIFTRGKRPYADIGNSYHELKQFFGRGRRLERPTYCTKDVYELMMSCWERDPHKRKTFRELADLLAGLLQSGTPAQTKVDATDNEEKHLSEVYFVPRDSTIAYYNDPGAVNDYMEVITGPDTRSSPTAPSPEAKGEYMVPTPSIKHDAINVFVPSMEELLNMQRAGEPVTDTYFTNEGSEEPKKSKNPLQGLDYLNKEEINDEKTSDEEKENMQELPYVNYTANGTRYENTFELETIISTDHLKDEVLREGEEREEDENSQNEPPYVNHAGKVPVPLYDNPAMVEHSENFNPVTVEKKGAGEEKQRVNVP